MNMLRLGLDAFSYNLISVDFIQYYLCHHLSTYYQGQLAFGIFR